LNNQTLVFSISGEEEAEAALTISPCHHRRAMTATMAGLPEPTRSRELHPIMDRVESWPSGDNGERWEPLL